MRRNAHGMGAVYKAEGVLSCIGMNIIAEMSGFVALPTPDDFR